jgi:hypothetical protein
MLTAVVGGRKRRFAFIPASPNDLEQCVEALDYLIPLWERGVFEWVSLGNAEVNGEVLATSIHRNPEFTDNVTEQMGYLDIDVAAIGAGASNHISAGTEARMRNMFKNPKTVVVAFAIEHPTDKFMTWAARLGTSKVPGTQCVYKDEDGEFVGPGGVLRACIFAIERVLPANVIPDEKPPRGFDPYAARAFGKERQVIRAQQAAAAAGK